MPNPANRPNPYSRAHVIWRTLFAIAVFLIFGFGILVYQLYALQLRDAELYRTEAVTQQMSDTELPAVRGSIYSANGKLLAKSSTVWNIIADPKQSQENGADDRAAAAGSRGDRRPAGRRHDGRGRLLGADPPPTPTANCMSTASWPAAWRSRSPTRSWNIP